MIYFVMPILLLVCLKVNLVRLYTMVVEERTIFSAIDYSLFEPRSEKTGLRGFRPGSTQTRLYGHRRWLEA